MSLENSMKFSYCVVTVSDTCFNDSSADKSGACLAKEVADAFPKASFLRKVIVADEVEAIVCTLRNLCKEGVNLVLTTGGTGISKRDVTPEATKLVIEKEIHAITQTMLIRSLNVTHMAMLSRATAGVRDGTLIVNLPGSAKGATECFHFIKSVLPHAIHLITDHKQEIQNDHDKIQNLGKVAKKCEVKTPISTEIDDTSPSLVNVNLVAMRCRESPYEMVSVKEADHLVYEVCKNNDITEINIENSLNRILAEDIQANSPFPPFRASVKDGYAVKFEDGEGVRTVHDVMTAGDDPAKVILKNGQIVRISTGACVPEGANAVVQVEDTALVEADSKGNEVRVLIKTSVVKGQDIREIGSDIPAGTTVFTAREKISPAHIGVLATLGKLTVKVFRRASIAILSTGNELSPYYQKDLSPGHVRDSNKLTLLNLLRKYGYKASDCGIVKDRPNCLKAALTTAFRQHDVIVTTGGVSMGEYDLIKEVLKKDFDAVIHFGRIDMKPGKPTTLATCNFKGSRKIVFALPGNPVSATVTCYLFVIPGLNIYEGAHRDCYQREMVYFENDVKLDERPEFRRVTLKRRGEKLLAYNVGNQISSRLNSCAGAHALVLLPSRRDCAQNVLFAFTQLPAILLDPISS